MSRPRALISWSTGKDAAWALHEVRRAGTFEIVGALTTVNSHFDRVAMHGVRATLLRDQLDAAGLAPRVVPLPWPCSNEVYEARMGPVLTSAREDGVTHVVFGDLFLQDVRAYRERQLRAFGLTAHFPLWGRDTAALAREMVAAGVRASLTCVDLARLDRSWAGRTYDAQLLASLPPSVDPCGENGEFHTFVTAGPALNRPVAVRLGEVVDREGFAFADLIPVQDAA